MKTYGGGKAPPFLTSAPDGGEWSASHSDLITCGEIAPGTHWRGELGGPQSRSERYGKEKNLAMLGIEPGPSSP
jgi:hypothetical protein